MVSDVKKLCKGAHVDRNGLAIQGSKVKDSRKALEGWL